MRTIILQVLAVGHDILVTNARGIIYGNFVKLIANTQTGAREWVFYPIKNVYIKEYALSEICDELRLLNKINAKEDH